MRHLGMFCAAVMAAGSVVGCGQFTGMSSPKGGMAVVDLDKVASETGKDRLLANSLELAQNSLNQSLKKTLDDTNEQLAAKKKTYGDDLSEEEKVEYTKLANSAASQLTQVQNRARAQYEQYKQQEIAKFRADLKPIAQEIASKRGLSIVIPKNEGLLLSVDSGVDITDEVIKVYREKHPISAAPAPKVEPVTTPAPAQSNAKANSPKRAPAKAAAFDDDAQDSRR